MPALASGQPYGASAVLSAWSAYSLLAAVTGVNAGSWPAGGRTQVEKSKHGGLGRGFPAYPSAVPRHGAAGRGRRRRPAEPPPRPAGAAELAQRLGYGRQYVHRQVSRHLGLPPHTLARLQRFQLVAAAVRAGQQAPGQAGLGWPPPGTPTSRTCIGSFGHWLE
jgi:AraC-like DNA-binding protein